VEVVVVYFKIVSQHLSRGTKEDDEKPTPPQPHPGQGPAMYEAEAVRGVPGVPIGPNWAFS
jgi:hypothetical protein